MSLIPNHKLHFRTKIQKSSLSSLTGIQNSQIPVVGTAIIEFQIQETTQILKHTMFVYQTTNLPEQSSKSPILLGADWLSSTQGNLSFQNNTLTLKQLELHTHFHWSPHFEHFIHAVQIIGKQLNIIKLSEPFKYQEIVRARPKDDFAPAEACILEAFTEALHTVGISKRALHSIMNKFQITTPITQSEVLFLAKKLGCDIVLHVDDNVYVFRFKAQRLRKRLHLSVDSETESWAPLRVSLTGETDGWVGAGASFSKLPTPELKGDLTHHELMRSKQISEPQQKKTEEVNNSQESNSNQPVPPS